MLKNYFVLDLSKVSCDHAEELFFSQIHLDSKNTHFEIITSEANLLTPRLRSYNIAGTLEITSVFVDQNSTSLYGNSIDKAYFKHFHYISFFNHEFQSKEFVETQLEVPARIYYGKTQNSNQQHVNSVFTHSHNVINFSKSTTTQARFAGAPFFGTCFPVTQLTEFSFGLEQIFTNLKHSQLVGLFLSQALLARGLRGVYIPENITEALLESFRGQYQVATNKNRIQIKKLPKVKTFFKNLVSNKNKKPKILKEIYN